MKTTYNLSSRLPKTVLAAASFFTIAFAVASARAQNEAKAPVKQYLFQFKAKDKFQRSRIADLGVSIESIIGDKVTAIGTEHNLARAQKSGLLEQVFQLTAKVEDFPPEDSQYHNYQRLTDDMHALAAQYPNLIRISSIGKSVEGRDLWLLTFSTDGKDLSRPAVFFMGGHHAREHLSVEVPFYLAKYLAAHYAQGDQRIVSLLNSRTVYIVPLVNPDGAEYDISNGEYHMWRKNRRDNGDGSFGVDLNRNYGYDWSTGGASSDPSDETYAGPSAFSEPETRAVKAFFDSHSNITEDLTFHTFSELILYPWGHTYDRISDQKAYMVHKTMAETMAQWNGYTPEQSSALYVASGDTTDWAFGVHGIISFTFELDPGSMFDAESGFYPGEDEIQPVFQKNLEPCLYMLNYADNPYRVLDNNGPAYGLNSPLLR